MSQNSQSTGTAVALAPSHSAGGALSVFSSVENFETAQRMAKALAASDLVPETYRNNVGNCMIAMEVASRTGASILAVTQNLHVIQGRPSWGSSFIIAALNSCGRFQPVRFDMADKGQKSVEYSYWDGPKGGRQRKTGKLEIADRECIAWTVPAAVAIPLDVRTLDDARKRNLPIIEGPPVSIEIAVREGWYTKNDSKWQTMPDLMLRYRAAAFFGRLYAPDVLMGMHTDEEVHEMPEPMRDITPAREAQGEATRGAAPTVSGPMDASEATQDAKPAEAKPQPAKAAEAKTEDASGDDGSTRRRGRPSKEELEAASEAGAQACRDGTPHTDVPEEFGTPSLTKAWQTGWYAEAAKGDGGEDGDGGAAESGTTEAEVVEAERVDAEPAAKAKPAPKPGDFDTGEDGLEIPAAMRRTGAAAAPFDPPKDGGDSAAESAAEMTHGDDDGFDFGNE